MLARFKLRLVKYLRHEVNIYSHCNSITIVQFTL